MPASITVLCSQYKKQGFAIIVSDAVHCNRLQCQHTEDCFMHPRFLLQTSAHKKEKLLFISAGQKISIVVLFEKRPIFLSIKT
jgi:hypothetical protein